METGIPLMPSARIRRVQPNPLVRRNPWLCIAPESVQTSACHNSASVPLTSQ
jgi:hypothetical protein